MIGKTERQQIRQLLQSPQWSALESLAKDLKEKFTSDTVVKDTEWDTLRETLMREGKIRGIELFIQEVYKSLENDN